jgi:hypothetical protein
VLKFYFASIISVPQHLYGKREGSGSRSGSPKTCGSGSPTLEKCLSKNTEEGNKTRLIVNMKEYDA